MKSIVHPQFYTTLSVAIEEPFEDSCIDQDVSKKVFEVISSIWKIIFYEASVSSNVVCNIQIKTVVILSRLIQKLNFFHQSLSASQNHSQQIYTLVASSQKTCLIAIRFLRNPLQTNEEIRSQLHQMYAHQTLYAFAPLLQLTDEQIDVCVTQNLPSFNLEASSCIVQNILHFLLSRKKIEEAHAFAYKAKRLQAIPQEILQKVDDTLFEVTSETLSTLSKKKLYKITTILLETQSNMECATKILSTVSALANKVHSLSLLQFRNLPEETLLQYKSILTKFASYIENIIRKKNSFDMTLSGLSNARRLELCLLALSFSDSFLAEHLEEPLRNIQIIIEERLDALQLPPRPIKTLFTKSEQTRFREEILNQFGVYTKTMKDWSCLWNFYTETSLVNDLFYFLDIKNRTPLFTSVSRKEVGLSPINGLPTLSDLIEDFESRPWSDSILSPDKKYTVRGFLPSWNEAEYEAVKASDKARFLNILRAHNARFCARVESQRKSDFSTAEKINRPSKNLLYIQPDLHSDLATPLALLRLFREIGRLDKENHFRDDFQIAFLGDYTDRGINDIEILSLLLLLRIENPSHVFLLRGNHENIFIQRTYSFEGSWLFSHKEELAACYASFPTALCAGAQERTPKGRHEYLHCSHALFSTVVDLDPFLSSDQELMTIPLQQAITAELSATIAAKSAKQQRAYERLAMNTVIQDEEMVGYLWSDVGDPSGPSLFRDQCRQLAPVDIKDYLKATSGKEDVVTMMVHGHKHVLEEHLVAKTNGVGFKLIGVGLPAAHIGGSFTPPRPRANIPLVEGYLLEIAPRVREWTVYPTVLDGSGATARITLLAKSFKLGESITSAFL